MKELNLKNSFIEYLYSFHWYDWLGKDVFSLATTFSNTWQELMVDDIVSPIVYVFMFTENIKVFKTTSAYFEILDKESRYRCV